jgi:NRAMP (natural resistance-associated macrophage protein)-like metal ion transporter
LVEDIRNFLRVFGPAWLVMIADVDVASIIEGLEAGAAWGYRMVFIMLILTFPLFFIQDAAGMLGTVGGMGLGEAIRKRFGARISLMASVPMATSDFLEYVVEYAGMAVGLYLLGIPVATGLLAIFMVHFLVIYSRHYKETEEILLPISFILVAAIAITTIIFKPDLAKVVNLGLNPLQPYNNPSFDYIMAASIGAVIMPWMLFFHSGADSRKKLNTSDLRNERIETLVGAVVSEVLMAIVVIDGSFIRGNMYDISAIANTIALAGRYARLVLGIGFLASGFLALVVISMGSAWGVLEAMGLKGRGQYYKIYLIESLPALAIVLLVNNYLSLILDLMIIYTVILIPLLIFLGKLVMDRTIMNSRTLKKREVYIYWLMSAAISIGGLLGLASIFNLLP